MKSLARQILTLTLSFSFVFTAPVSYAQNQPAFGPSYGDVLHGILSPEGSRILYSGEVDELGRQRVWSYGGQDANNKGIIRQGVVETNGAVTWDGAYNSRKAGQQYPNYPEAKGRPIQPGRALVPAGEVQTVPRGSGSAEVNSPGKEYFPEMDPRFKPSRFKQAANLTAAQMRFVKAEIQKLVTGKPNALVGSNPKTTGADITENVRAPNYELARGVAGFYIGMGLIAAITLYADYGNNPAAWTSYINSLTDPMGVAYLAAFMAAAGGSYWAMSRMSTKMFGPEAMTKGLVARPVMVGSIAVGALVSTVLMEVMADPNTSKCLGFDKLKTGEFPYRDYTACDALWDRWSSNSHWNNMAVNQLVPMFANIVVAGGMWQATLIGTEFLFSRQAIAVGLRSLRFGFSANGGWVVKLIGAAVNVAVFMGAYYISDNIFGVGQWVREEMIDTWSFSNDPHGASIQETEGLLLKQWAALKKSNFKNPNQWEKVCFDSSRKYNMFFNCAEPNQLDFITLLNKYGDFQQQWRKVKMTDAENAYKQWRLKSDEYYYMLELAYDFYNAALETPQNFNEKFVADFVKLQDAANQENWKFLKGANTDGDWKYVSTYKATDYLIASMACGPEAENIGQNVSTGVFGKIGSFWTNWISGNTSPKEVLSNSDGWKIAFHPPRITQPLARGESNICQTGGFSSFITLLTPTTRVEPRIFPSSTDQGSYQNMFDYIRAEVRPAVYENGQNKFADWWEKFITPPSNDLDAQLRKDYEALLNKEYLKPLIKKDYKRCYPSRLRDTGLEKYTKQLGSNDDTCAPEALDRLSHGVLLSLRDEMRLYLAMLIDLQVSNVSRLGNHVGLSDLKKFEADAIDNAQALLSVMDRMLDGAKQIETAKRLDLKQITIEWFAISNAHKRLMIGPRSPAPALDSRLADLREQMKAKMDQIMKTPEAGRARLQYDLQMLQKEWDRVEKSIPRPTPNVFEQSRYLENWAFALGLKVDSTFEQALNLYKILTLFEQP